MTIVTNDLYTSSTQTSYIFSLKVSLENSTDTHISLSHTVNKREIWGTCKGMRRGILPQEWELLPLGHVISPPIPHQAPGIGGRAYH